MKLLMAWERLKVMATGMVTWEDEKRGIHLKEKLTWNERWAIFGIHSYNWWWVRHWGTQHCGCVINPLTRRQVLFCKLHSSIGQYL